MKINKIPHLALALITLSSLLAVAYNLVQINTAEISLAAANTSTNGLNKPEFTPAVLNRPIISIGTSGDDVRAIQEILNSDDLTKIAKTGINSPGLENGIFDTATQAAVKRFQEKYKIQNTFRGTPLPFTGTVEGTTKNKFSDLLQQRNQWYRNRDTLIPKIVNGNQNDLQIVTSIKSLYAGKNYERALNTIKTNPTSANPGATVKLFGTGFLYVAKPAIQIANTILPLSVISNYEATFTLPTQMPSGIFYLYGTSTDPSTPAHAIAKTYAQLSIQLTAAQTPKNQTGKGPNIYSLSPDKTRHGKGVNEMVTIKGDGFTPTGNTVWTPYGMIENIPSTDGTTLTFKMYLEPLNRFYQIRQKLHDNDRSNGILTEYRYQLGVMNANGASPQRLFHTSVIWWW